MKKTFLILLTVLITINANSQRQYTLYDDTYNALSEMLDNDSKLDFKKAVFSVENCFLNGVLDYKEYNNTINYYKILCQKIIESRELQYQESDKSKVSVYASVFTVMKDSILILQNDSSVINNLPFNYDFEDINGNENWTKMFVTKLLATKKGNCHSLPYLYKILVEELDEKAHLAYAPNHIYLKQQCKEFGWYNIELTSAIFPIDAWLMASGYIHLSAIQNGIYMSALTDKQSICACLLDLALGYEKKYLKNDGTFILKICNKVLTYHPNNINALLLQAETKMRLWENQTNQTIEQKTTELNNIQSLYAKIHQLGYRNMPEEMYLDWLVSLKEEKIKYQNRRINLKIK